LHLTVRRFLLLFLLIAGCVELPTKAYDNPLDQQTQSEEGIEPPALVFAPDSVSVTSGNAVTVNAFVMGADSLMGAHLQIEYDNSLVSFTTVTIGNFFSGGTESFVMAEDDSDNGLLDVYVSFGGGSSLSVSGNGNIANITFSTLAVGKTVLTFTSASELADPDDNPIQIKGYGEGVIDAN
jgi:hypothetical protein